MSTVHRFCRKKIRRLQGAWGTLRRFLRWREFPLGGVYGIPLSIDSWGAIGWPLLFACTLVMNRAVDLVPCLIVILAIHEFGHAWVARRYGYRVHGITFGLFHGGCIYDEPTREYEHAVIAWGGVAAQTLLFVPASAALVVFGYSEVPIWRDVQFNFVVINLVIIVINLLPVTGLDGATAWRLIPLHGEMRRWKKELRDKAPWQ